ncbi:MAG: hypothetical protein AMJ75_01970 [Phycisphaerae bacterium SM1_79]|nr:MAG: hypothetical protein AMJ75_01970 [Phycisphaerae bacterium SM1_79]
METNSIYVTKKEFYSVTTGILACVLLTVAFSKEFEWREYVLSFVIGASFIWSLCKGLKERGRCANSKPGEN